MLFLLDGLNALIGLKIGKNSFTKVTEEMWNDPDIKTAEMNNSKKSFHILNCESLQMIEIGEFSFSDYEGEFELMNLPALQSIRIGSLEHTSLNFRYSQCVIRSLLYFLSE